LCYRTYKADRVARFWEKADKGEGDTCWQWRGATTKKGYGTYRIIDNGHPRMIGAHCFAFLLAGGTIPSGTEVCHVCDNPACINPSHLWVGTHQENMKDASVKGRIQCGDLHYTRRMPEKTYGSKNSQARLTEAQVRTIRSRAMHGTTHNEMAVQFHVSRPTISMIVEGRTWKHIAMEVLSCNDLC
jgi:DNA-binding XRE family transcriptional regulator